MAIRPVELFSGQVNPATSGYPYGKGRNISASGDGNGTPWHEAIVNDWWGFLYSLLDEAGIEPSGQPDAVGASQYLQSLKAIVDRRAVQLAAANWTPVDSGTNRNMLGIDYDPDAGVIVAAANGGRIIRSLDGGSIWSDVDVGVTGTNLTDIAYGNGVWIAVGFSGVLIRSTDAGQTWTLISNGVPTENLSGIAFDSTNGVFIAVGDAGTVIRSSDGQAWTLIGITPAFVDLHGVGFGNGVVLAVGFNGRVYRTADGGDNWTEPGMGGSTPNNLCAVYAGGRWMLGAESGVIYTSDDEGQSFTAANLPNFEDVHDLAWLDGVWIATGTKGLLMASTDNGDSWVSPGGGTSESLHAAITVQNRVIAAGVLGAVTRTMRPSL